MVINKPFQDMVKNNPFQDIINKPFQNMVITKSLTDTWLLLQPNQYSNIFISVNSQCLLQVLK